MGFTPTRPPFKRFLNAIRPGRSAAPPPLTCDPDFSGVVLIVQDDSAGASVQVNNVNGTEADMVTGLAWSLTKPVFGTEPTIECTQILPDVEPFFGTLETFGRLPGEAMAIEGWSGYTSLAAAGPSGVMFEIVRPDFANLFSLRWFGAAGNVQFLNGSTNHNPITNIADTDLHFWQILVDESDVLNLYVDGTLLISETGTSSPLPGTYRMRIGGTYAAVNATADLWYTGPWRVTKGPLALNRTPGVPTEPWFLFACAEPIVSVQMLVVGGGAGGGTGTAGAPGAGAGGAGGFVTSSADLPVGVYPVVIGAGGAAAADGNPSSFHVQTALGGGAGGSSANGNGSPGGSGGGGARGLGTGGAVLAAGQGNIGGTAGVDYGGGGGGASAPGTPFLGVGGAGDTSSISGAVVTYAGGGGGGRRNGSAVAPGGAGGGGAGANSGTPAVAGTANLGGGGGGGAGAGGFNPAGAAGGSGVVIVRYATADATCTGGTITTDGADTVHTFTASGDFEVVSIP